MMLIVVDEMFDFLPLTLINSDTDDGVWCDHIKWHRLQLSSVCIIMRSNEIQRERRKKCISTLSGWCLVSAFYCVRDNKAGAAIW